MLHAITLWMRVTAIACALVLLVFNSHLWETPTAALRGSIITTLLISSALGFMPTLTARATQRRLGKQLDELKAELRAEIKSARADDELSKKVRGNGHGTVVRLGDSRPPLGDS